MEEKSIETSEEMKSSSTTHAQQNVTSSSEVREEVVTTTMGENVPDIIMQTQDSQATEADVSKIKQNNTYTECKALSRTCINLSWFRQGKHYLIGQQPQHSRTPSFLGTILTTFGDLVTPLFPRYQTQMATCCLVKKMKLMEIMQVFHTGS